MSDIFRNHELDWMRSVRANATPPTVTTTTAREFDRCQHVATIPVWHELDFDKIQTVEDVKNILRVLNIRFKDECEDFDLVQPYIKGEQ